MRRLLAPLLGTALAASVLVLPVLPVLPAAADPAADVRAAQAEVTDLRAAVARSAAELSDATRELERGRARLAVVRAEAGRARRQSDAAQTAAEHARRRLGEVVGAAYRNPGPGKLAVALAAEPAEVSAAVRAVAEIDHVRGSQQVLLAEATAASARAQELADRASRLEAEAAQVARDLAGQVTALRRTAEADRVRFTAAAVELEKAQAARRAAAAAAAARASRARAAAAAAAQAGRSRAAAAAAAGAAAPDAALPAPDLRMAASTGATCTDTSIAGYANGFLPASALCPLAGAGGHRLRKDAAEAYNRMAAAGAPCITDSYRDYAGQVSVFARKPGLAAVPGTSNHGLGVAVDVGCGASSFGSPAYAWLKANGPRYGWTHPAWAEPGGSRPEPWHWEFTG